MSMVAFIPFADQLGWRGLPYAIGLMVVFVVGCDLLWGGQSELAYTPSASGSLPQSLEVVKL
jgi:hypothetical protein